MHRSPFIFICYLTIYELNIGVPRRTNASLPACLHQASWQQKIEINRLAVCVIAENSMCYLVVNQGK